MPPKRPSSPAARLTTAAIRKEIRTQFGNPTFGRAVGIHQHQDDIELIGMALDDSGSLILDGNVQGGARNPYDVNVLLYVDLGDAEFFIDETNCSCPVGLDCKHAAALLLTWLDGCELDGDTIIGLPMPALIQMQNAPKRGKKFDALTTIITAARKATPASARPTAPPPAQIVTHRLPLPGPLSQWLNNAFRDVDKDASTRALSKQSFAPCIFYVLTDERDLCALKGRIRGDGRDAELTGEWASSSWLNSARERPAYADEADRAALLLIFNAKDFYGNDLRARLSGVHGAQLLDLAYNTGRLYTMAATKMKRGLHKRSPLDDRRLSKPLVIDYSRLANLSWETHAAAEKIANVGKGAIKAADKHGEHTVVSLAAECGGMPLLLIPTAPPYGLDITTQQLIPIDSSVSINTIERVAALPPLRHDDVLAWTFVSDALAALPDAASLPPLPATIHIPALPMPAPILNFIIAEITYNMGWGRNQKEQQVVFPAVQLVFDYKGTRLPFEARGFETAIEEDQLGTTVTARRIRNVRVEREWLARMPAGLLRAAQVEHTVTYAAQKSGDGNNWQSLWALPRHDWAHDGAAIMASAQMAGFTIEIDSAFPLMLKDIPEPELELSPAQENGWFRIALGVTVDGERVDLAPALAKLIGAQKDPEQWLEQVKSIPSVLLSVARKGAADIVKGAIIVRITGERVHAILAPIFDWFRGGEVAPLSALQAALMPDLRDDTVIYLGRDNPRWFAMRTAIAEGAALKPVQPAPGFGANLRAYQQSGLAWLMHLRTLSMGGVLADDMGLGKTVQTLAYLHSIQSSPIDGGRKIERKPSLIVAPTSVTVNWLAEARKFTPTLRVLMHHGAARERDKAAIKNADVVLTSYAILQRDEKFLAAIEFDSVIFDEAQMIKNPKAKTYQAAQRIRANTRLALTGTPMENHLGDLWSLFNLLLPGLLGDLESFNRIFRHPIEQRAVSEQMQKLRARVRPFLLRRTREQVLSDLPEKTEYTRWIELAPKQADLYESVRTAIHDDIRKVIDKKGLKQSTIHILDALLKLRQVCCDPRLVKLPQAKKHFSEAGSAKLDWLKSHVPELLEEGRQILIFSQFTSMLVLIGEALDAEKIEYVILTGDTLDRETPIARFQAGEVRVFLLSLKAGGVGLNLTAADTVIHYDPWWNPAVEAQATARAHRIGQTKPVFVTRLISQGTLEERMMVMLERKRGLAAALLNGEGSALTGITLADVESLLAPITSLEGNLGGNSA